jgi:hypothetical protein
LKEQGRLIDAELEYRNAFALGDTSSDLIRHIRYVSRAGGVEIPENIVDSVCAYWANPIDGNPPLACPPTWRDINDLYSVLFNRNAATMEEVRAIINQASTISDVIVHLLKTSEFATANRDLIALLAESNGARK